MKKWNCAFCNTEIEIYDEYEPKYCCDGWMCGCRGEPINPMFCDECVIKIFGEQ